jgi:AraC-like DNA-binding protein
MHAHFTGQVYHRHSHETYSFGVTHAGAQGFTCRGSSHVSAAGMVMAFNPDDPHDGHAATGAGFTYTMIHIGPQLLSGVLADIAGRAVPLPLFAAPVITDPALAAALRRLHAALTGPEGPLQRDEQLARVVSLLTRHASGRGARAVGGNASAAGPGCVAAGRATGAGDREAAAERVRALLREGYATAVTGADVAAAAGLTRYAAYRAFRSRYGLAPSEYQRQLRLRAARRALAGGAAIADAAAAAGFADQAHLTRWFRRCYGVTPGAYRDSAGRPGESKRVLDPGS